MFMFLHDILNDLRNNTPGLEASGILSTDGIELAAQYPEHFNVNQISDLSAKIHSLSKHVTHSLDRGELEHVMVQGKIGQLILVRADVDVILGVLASPESELLPILQNMSNAAKTIKQALINSLPV